MQILAERADGAKKVPRTASLAEAPGLRFSNQVSGTFTLNFGGCVRVERFTGTLIISLNGADGEASSDNGRYEVVSNTCPNGSQAGSVLNAGFPTGRATRSGDSVTYSATEVVGINTGEASFTGTVSGNTINGTFSHSQRIDVAFSRYTTTVSLTKR